MQIEAQKQELAILASCFSSCKDSSDTDEDEGTLAQGAANRTSDTRLTKTGIFVITCCRLRAVDLAKLQHFLAT